MSKRNISSRNLATKRPRVDEFNDFWDDDLDGDAIDACFKRATQENDAQNNDVMLLSSYSIFKEPKRMFTSTQLSQPSISGQGNFEHKVQELQEKYAAKEGEVSILRSNLQNLKASCHLDQEKKQVEWKEKLCVVEKENKTIKSELEFKNLEIVNLKQQIAELSRFVNVEQSCTQRSQAVDGKIFIASPEKQIKKSSNGSPRIYINVEKYYPLKSFNFSFISKSLRTERCMMTTRFNLCKDTEYLETRRKFPVFQLPETIFLNPVGELDVDLVYQELLYLISLSSEDLNSDRCIPCINKVILFSLQLLRNFHDSLKKNEITNHCLDVQDFDAQHLPNSRFKETSFMCGEILDFFGEILPFNAYLKNYLLSEELNSTPNHNMDCAPYDAMKKTQTPHCLILIANAVSAIAKAKKEKEYVKFLSAVLRLLCRIFTTKIFNYLPNTVIEIAKQLLLLNPDFEVIYETVVFLNIITRGPNFVSFICSSHENVKGKSNKEFCRFHKFLVVLENMLTKIKNEKVFSRFSSTVLSFIYNIFRLNSAWLHQQENKTCECLCKLYKLTIGIIYKNLELYEKPLCKARPLLNIHVKILSLLTFNAYDLTQKYVTDFAQFKEIVYTLSHIEDEMDHTNLKNLEKLSTAEDFPYVPREKFIAVDL